MDPRALLADVPAPATRGTMRVEQKSERLEPGAMVGEYRIEHHVVAGGMGDIYAASHPLIGKRAAVKVLDQSLCKSATMVQRFVQEARVVNAIGHANIVDIFSLGELPDGRVFLIMEWLDGESLHARLRRGAMAVGEACQILEQVADAVEAAHQAGVVHRDLKPANIFLARSAGRPQEVKLLDFGIAKLVGPLAEAATPTPETEVGVVMGTPGYLAPEQETGGPVGPPADIYAFGVVLYMALFGQRPIEALAQLRGEDAPSHIRSPKAVCPELPDAVAEVMLRTYADDPAQRPTWNELRAALQQLRQGPLRLRILDPQQEEQGAPSSFSADTETMTDLEPSQDGQGRGGERRARRRRAWGVALGGGLALCAAALLWTLAREEAPSTSAVTQDGRSASSTVRTGAAAEPAAPAVSTGHGDAGDATVADGGAAGSGAVEAGAADTGDADSGVAALASAGPLTLVVRAPSPTISIDGRVVSRGRSQSSVVGLSAGSHRVHISAPRHRSRVLEVELLPGVAKELVVELQRARARPQRPGRRVDAGARAVPPPAPESDSDRDLDYTVDPFENR